MKTPKAIRLRWRLAVPLLVTFTLLWLGIVILLYLGARDQLELRVGSSRQTAQESVEEQWKYYQDNLERGLGAEAGHILTLNISSGTLGLVDYMDGGAATVIRDSQGTVIRSQLAWGYGHQDGIDVGQRWHFYLDQGLDDQGQLDLARWIIAHREGWEYSVYPKDTEGFTENPPDGTFVRVTGVELPGYAIAAENIQLIHPDGSMETVVETAPSGQETITMDFTFFKLRSVLLPSYWSDGRSGYVDMERRLANYREAQAILDRELAGEDRVVRTGEAFLFGMGGGDSMTARYCAFQYQSMPYLLRANGISYLLLLLLTAAAALVLASHLSKKVRLPAEELCREAEAGRCSTHGPITELNTLAAAFNAAQDQLAGQLERERGFTRAAAHELKTPLAVLRAHAEALREDIDPEKRGQYLDVVMEESDRMAALVSSLLELSRLESGIPLRLEMVELPALLREAAAPLALPMEQKSIDLVTQLPEVWVEGDRERLKGAAENLLSNALRHCTPGGTIRLSLAQAEDTARLTVYNDGQPVAPQDLPHLFEPFYRGDKSRSRDSGGTGLGLAIVMAAMKAHNGGCQAENRPGGVAFTLWLPLAQPDG